MADELERAIEELGDTRAGWVTRRDAAQTLGRIATQALKTLAAHAADNDQDVRGVVTEALGWARAGLDGIEPVAQERAYALDELIKYIEKPGSREVSASGDGYDITVSLNDGRKQHVHVGPGTSQSGLETVQVKTRCGPAPEKALKWALRNNVGLTHCGMALVEENGEEYLEMVNSFLADAVTPAEFKACVKEIAFYGDWADGKLTKGDTF